MIVEKIKVRKGDYKVICKCDWCGKEIVKKYGDTIKTKHHFCSLQCFGKWESENRTGKNHPTFGKHLSKEWKINIGNGGKGKQHSEKTKSQISQKNRKTWIIETPIGVITTPFLKEFCKKHNIHYGSLLSSFRQNCTPKIPYKIIKRIG